MSIVRRWLIALLVLQLAHTAALRWITPSGGDSAATSLPWTIFLYALPIGLVALILAGQRWALMASAMYATVSLALDIATFVFGITHSATPLELILSSGPSAALNFAVIVLGGQGFLYDRPQDSVAHKNASGYTRA